MFSTPLQAGGLGFSGRAPALYDPLWSYVTLLMHFDGVGSPLDFLDEKSSGVEFSAQGNATLSSTGPKFGDACLALDGTGDWIQTTSGLAVGALGAGDFCVEVQAYLQKNSVVVLDCGWDSSGTNKGWQFYINGSGKLVFYSGSGGGAGTASTDSVVLNAWNYLACRRYSGTMDVSVNGSVSGAVASSTNFDGTGITKIGVGAQIQSRNASYDVQGRVDEWRITKGASRSISAVPSSAFPHGA